MSGAALLMYSQCSGAPVVSKVVMMPGTRTEIRGARPGSEAVAPQPCLCRTPCFQTVSGRTWLTDPSTTGTSGQRKLPPHKSYNHNNDEIRPDFHPWVCSHQQEGLSNAPREVNPASPHDASQAVMRDFQLLHCLPHPPKVRLSACLVTWFQAEQTAIKPSCIAQASNLTGRQCLALSGACTNT